MKRIIYIYIVIFAFLSFSCSDDEIIKNPTLGLHKISEGYALGAAAKVELWAMNETLIAGYNEVWFAVYDSVKGNRLTDLHVSFYPEMDMGEMKHTTYFENPEESVDEIFPASVAFVMPTSDMGTWGMKVEVHNHANRKTGAALLDFVVTAPVVTEIKSFVTSENEKIFITRFFPDGMKVGINDFEVIAFRKASYSDFPAVTDLDFTLDPEMPSMEHGSPNNVDPVHVSNGHYLGKVNFTMTGEWRLNLTASRNESVLSELFFDVTLD